MTIETTEQLFAPNLPQRIKEARARAVEHPQLFLKGKVTALVQVLITYTNLDRINTPIRFNRERPAKILGVSTRTIDRLLKNLESLGWLKRLPQPRLDEGSWGCTSISWAQWVIDEVFTAVAVQDKWGSRARKSTRSTKTQAYTSGQKVAFEAKDDARFSHIDRATQSAHLSSSPKGEVFQNKGVAAASSEESQNQNLLQGRRIPADLVGLITEFDLTPANICWLMARCKAQGKRLQHVLSATIESLRTKGLRSRQALSWLMYMVNLKRDYAYEARQADERKREASMSERRTKFLDLIAQKVFTPGRRLPGNLVVVDYANGLVTTTKAGTNGFGACPAKTMARGLVKQDPWWVRRVLRGLDAATVTDDHTATTSAKALGSSPAKEGVATAGDGATGADKATSRSHLANIKQMLARSRFGSVSKLTA